jgi:hypothetical protein
MNRSLSVEGKSEYESLYTWHIKEQSEDGQRSTDYIPWFYRCYFRVTEISYAPSLELQRWEDLNSYSFDSAAKIRESERIRASLVPDERFGFTEYSMFGTNRVIEEIVLEIHRSSDQSEGENVVLNGIPQYSMEIDFADETQPDWLGVSLFVNEARFKKIAEMIEQDAVSSMYLNIGYAKGCYAEWTPGISANVIKILTPDHGLKIPKECDIELPCVGEVGEFALHINSRRELLLGAPIVETVFEEDEDENSEELYVDEHPIPTVTERLQEQIRDELISLRETNEQQQSLLGALLDEASKPYQPRDVSLKEKYLEELTSIRESHQQQRKLLWGVITLLGFALFLLA